ncbi:MAG: hypothetical protein BHV68_07345 [Bacteroidales bacterium 43_8]|nr:MAG: hypothetical protein BHV68_07345 [Bacteroidales bacterium 43_8]
MKKSVQFLLLFLMCISASWTWASDAPERTVLFNMGDYDSQYWRIPALVTAADNSLVDANMQTQRRFPKRTALLPRCRGSGSLLNAGLSIVLLFCYDGKTEKTKKEGKNGNPIHI